MTSPPLESRESTNVDELEQRMNDCTARQKQPKVIVVAQLYDTFTSKQVRCTPWACLIRVRYRFKRE